MLKPSPVAFAGHLDNLTLGLQISFQTSFHFEYEDAEFVFILHASLRHYLSFYISLQLPFVSLSLTYHFVSYLVFGVCPSVCLCFPFTLLCIALSVLRNTRICPFSSD